MEVHSHARLLRCTIAVDMLFDRLAPREIGILLTNP